uniref:Uncharacterized protein n=1 Tax=Picea glauca TaxID=3330 RepID=A0A101LX87_PICGL|nr:hypothetical protein ABT39_MTgene6014 [Picea glauca]
MRKQARPTGEEISGCYYICNYAFLPSPSSLSFVKRVATHTTYPWPSFFAFGLVGCAPRKPS